MPPLDRRPRCKSESSTFGKAGWIASRLFDGQGRVSTPSACEPPSCERALVAPKGRLFGKAAPRHVLGRPWTVGPSANLSWAPFEEAGLIAARPSFGQGRVSMPSA